MTAYVGFQSDADSVWDVIRLATGNTAFDIGANGGLVSTQLSGRFETVVACEPAIESYARLESSSPANVRPLNVAVSKERGTLSLRETTLTGKWGELFTGESMPWGDHVGYREVQAVTLDDLSSTYGFPDFIKVDTEGHEVQVLQGGPATLLSRPRFVIEIHSVENGAIVESMLDAASMPYDLHHHPGYGQSSRRLAHYWVASPCE